MTGPSLLSTEEKARDIRVMLKRGCSIDHIRGVFGWGPKAFTDFCASHDIALPSMRNLSVQQREPKRAYARREPWAVRSVTLSAVTTPEIAAAIAREAERRNTAKGHLLHLILAATWCRGLWPQLLNDSGPAFPENSERQ